MLKGCSTPSAGQPSAGQPSAGQPSAGPRASHDNLRTPNVHISGPRRFKHHQREGEKNDNCGRRGKKKREILGPPPFGAPPFGAPPFGAPPFGASTLQGPTLCCPKIQHPEVGRSRIGRSRNWPKSKKKLAEVEIGRSRSRSRVWRSRKRADRGGSALRCDIQMTTTIVRLRSPPQGTPHATHATAEHVRPLPIAASTPARQLTRTASLLVFSPTKEDLLALNSSTRKLQSLCGRATPRPCCPLRQELQ